MLLSCRKSVLNFTKNYFNLQVWILKWNWTCFRNLSFSQENVSVGKKKKKLGIAVIIFCMQIYWKEKKHAPGRNLRCHLVQDFTSKKWTILTFGTIPEKKIPYPLLITFATLYCPWVFLMLCLKFIFLLHFKWKEALGQHLVSVITFHSPDGHCYVPHQPSLHFKSVCLAPLLSQFSNSVITVFFFLSKVLSMSSVNYYLEAQKLNIILLPTYNQMLINKWGHHSVIL